jgi:predicted phosphohydrolase
MTIYAIGDLHFSGLPPTKPMEKFGAHWAGHRDKVLANWQRLVQPADLVLVCGDISWGMTLAEAKPDLDSLTALPGHKILLKGNHDYWWTSLAKMQAAYPGRFAFLQNNFYSWGETAICGTRGWILPGVEGFNDDDVPRLRREALRLEMSLGAAQKAGFTKLICMLHYPAFYYAGQESPFRSLLEEYHVQTCVFGHIHGAEAAQNVFQGQSGGCSYQLVSCDTIGFAPMPLTLR